MSASYVPESLSVPHKQTLLHHRTYRPSPSVHGRDPKRVAEEAEIRKNEGYKVRAHADTLICVMTCKCAHVCACVCVCMHVHGEREQQSIGSLSARNGLLSD